jgi:hypothetical protein
MRRQGRESAARNLIPETDYPKTGYYEEFELSPVVRPEEANAAMLE